MKALTLTQPWASLLATGQKRYETRSWKTNHRGLVAIHAAVGWPREARFAAARFGQIGTLKFGVVLGVGLILDCHRTEDIVRTITETEWRYGDWSPGRWAWDIEPILYFEHPVPAKGALGLWNWERPRDAR